MSVLVWKHGTTVATVRELIHNELEKLGHGGKVTWKGEEFSCLLGWGTILRVAGKVTDETIDLEKCSGAIGGTVLAKFREFFEQAFPGGEQA